MTRSVIQPLILVALATVSVLGFIAMPEGDNPEGDNNGWYITFAITKLIAGVTGYIFAILYNRWNKTNSWLKSYDKMCDEVWETPNQMTFENNNQN